MESGFYKGKKVGVDGVFEAVGKAFAGKITDEELATLETAACPGCGSCNGMFTANTMACMTEALGMSLPYCATALANGATKERIARSQVNKSWSLSAKTSSPPAS
jgi:dihydroxy-acid dehydratase